MTDRIELIAQLIAQGGGEPSAAAIEGARRLVERIREPGQRTAANPAGRVDISEIAKEMGCFPFEDIVAALYRAVVSREATADDLARYREAFFSGGATLEHFIRDLLPSPDFATKHPRLVHRNVAGRGGKFINDVTQCGEIEILVRQMVNDAAKHRIVVDVGARGRRGSNSYDLMRHFGWRGLLIEANPALVDQIREEFADLDFELVNCAVSNFEGTAMLHLGINDGVSSLNERFVANWGPTHGAVEVKVERLGDILDSRGIPFDFDLLSLDIEGEDIKVFNHTIDNYPYRPKWVIIEESFNFRVKSLQDIPLSPRIRNEYTIVGQTPANLVLQHLNEARSREAMDQL